MEDRKMNENRPLIKQEIEQLTYPIDSLKIESTRKEICRLG